MLETGSMWIINMAPIQNSLAIYKDISIFIAEYTGSVRNTSPTNQSLPALAVKPGSIRGRVSVSTGDSIAATANFARTIDTKNAPFARKEAY